MTLSPILRAKLNKFMEDYELKDMDNDDAFERFVNYHILSQQYPGAFDVDSELMDLICVGGGFDLGLDGIAISLNGRLIRNEEDIDDNLLAQKKGKFEITFIQSKYREKFDLGEYMKFTNGVIDFLNEEIKSPANEDIKKWHNVYMHMISDAVITKWDNGPVINLVYCSLGDCQDNEHAKGNNENVKAVIESKGIFDSISIRIVDSKSLLNIVNSNDSSYTEVVGVVDSMPLPQVDKVDNSSVIMCSANELIKLLTIDNMLRRNLFTDNVRDYQGDTSINREIHNTIINNPQEFVLLNNGITIVCDEMREVNRKITIKNPQIVNGCQTCNVLFNCWKNDYDLSNAYVVVKVIASSDSSIVSNIIKGTNRQNIVYDEAFEVTKDFHKCLEEYFKTIQHGSFEKIYYERRSKQFEGDDLVKPCQKVSFRSLIQSFVSIFLYKVHEGHHHESRLLQDYRDDIFLDTQSFAPYYLASFLNLQLDWMIRRKNVDKHYTVYKYHVLLILKELIGGESPNINNKKQIEKYCENFLEKIKTFEELLQYTQKACEMFDVITEEWVRQHSKYSIKDNYLFTSFMLEHIHSGDAKKIEKTSEKTLAGRILNFQTDKNGDYYGFIQKENQNIRYHEKNNPGIKYSDVGREVFYDVENSGTGIYATHMRFVN